MRSEDFRMELFTEPSEYEETPLRDRKSRLYNLRNHEEKAEFLRDVIALANTARLWGKPAYLIFGLDDNGNRVSIYQGLQPYRSEPSSTDEDLTRVMEEVRHQMSAAIREYIFPCLHLWDLKWEWDKSNNLLLAYLLIEPQCPENAFHVAKDLTSGRRALLSAEDSWIRSGESKTKIGRHSLDQCYPRYCQVPFIPPSKWLKYFNALWNTKEMQQAVHKMPYIDLYDTQGRSLQVVIQEFLQSDQQAILVITGSPGIGKTTLLYRIVAEWADAGRVAMEETRRREEFKQPPQWIPVYFPLREATFPKGLEKELLREANSKGQPFWEEEPSKPERLFERRELHWLICFDGLDELWEGQRIEQFLKKVRRFRRKYQQVKILLTTRPGVTIPDDFQKVQIAPLSREQVLTYLQAFVNEGNETYCRQLEEQFLNDKSELYPLWEICVVPLYLESLVSLLTPDVPTSAEEESPPLTLGWTLDRIVTRVWDREASRRPILQNHHLGWWRGTGKLGLSMDGHHEFIEYEKAKTYYFPRKGLQWVLNLGILHACRDGIGFSHRSLQHYFGAAYLKSQKEADRKKWESRCTQDFWHAVITLLKQIQYSEVSHDATEQRFYL